MKSRIITGVAGLMICCSVCAQRPAGFSLTGQIDGKSGGFLFMDVSYLSGRPTKRVPVDAKGHFSVLDTVNGTGPAEYSLIDPTGFTLFKGGAMMGRGTRFLARNGDHIVLHGTEEEFDRAKISGNPYDDKLMEVLDRTAVFQRQENLIWDQVKALMKERNPAVNQPKIDSLENLTDPIQAQIAGIKLNFARSHPDNYISAILLSDIGRQVASGDIDAAYNGLSPDVQQSVFGQAVLDILGRKKAEVDAQAGKPAAEFAKKDRDGNTIRLADYRGKYVLLDFWGSWCGACRASHPHLKELNAKYGPQGLVIIGIAEERTKNKSAWLNAIKEDGLPWTQIMNDEGKDVTDVVKLYGVEAFPTKILIDPQGNIVTRVVGTTMAGSATGNGHPPAGGADGATAAMPAGSAAAPGSKDAASAASGSSPAASSSASSAAAGAGANVEPPTPIDIKLKEIFKN
jgi:thiol-disulfide isomerase/thioredoxin